MGRQASPAQHPPQPQTPQKKLIHHSYHSSPSTTPQTPCPASPFYATLPSAQTNLRANGVPQQESSEPKRIIRGNLPEEKGKFCKAAPPPFEDSGMIIHYLLLIRRDQLGYYSARCRRHSLLRASFSNWYLVSLLSSAITRSAALKYSSIS